MPRQFMDLPFGLEMAPAAMLWAQANGEYTSADMTKALAEHYRLDEEQLGRRLRNGKLAFDNYVDWLLASWTRRGTHHRGPNGFYSLAPQPGGGDEPNPELEPREVEHLPVDLVQAVDGMPPALPVPEQDVGLRMADIHGEPETAQDDAVLPIDDRGTIEQIRDPDAIAAAEGRHVSSMDAAENPAGATGHPEDPQPDLGEPSGELVCAAASRPVESGDQAVPASAKKAPRGSSGKKVNGVDQALAELKGLNRELLRVLAANGITTLDALADLSSDELVEIAPMKKNKADKLIMAAREHWFSEP